MLGKIFRTVVLGLSILGLVAAPVPAFARGEQGHEPHGGGQQFHGTQEFHGKSEFHGRPEFHGHAHFVRPFVTPFVVEPFVGVYASPYVTAPPCAWQPGYWSQQDYTDMYGNTSTVPQWVPPQYVCS
jgi:hypothetical protein